MPGEALSIYRSRFVPLVLTCALALIPANLLMAGTVLVGLAGLGRAEIGNANAVEHEVHGGTADEKGAQLHQLAKPSEPAPDVLGKALPVAYAIVAAVVLLMLGIALAHAAMTPIVLGTAEGPAGAWAEVASRFGALARTAFVEAPLVAIGALFLILPGIALAVGFSLAVPAVIVEGVGGRAALERSVRLLRGHWAPAIGWWALLALFTVAATGLAMLTPVSPWRHVVSGGIRLFTYPLPLAGLILLYRRVSTSGESPPPDSSARGFPGTSRL